MHDVAGHAGVSVGTVSHVLNGSRKASLAATAAVHEAVAAFGYRPNSVARSLSARRVRKWPERQGERPRLVTIGYVFIDDMVSVDSVPMPGARMTSRGIEKMLGGPAANVAAFAASLRPLFDVDVEILSHIGIDADSEWALEGLSLRGVDASGTQRQPGGRLSRCIVLVDAEGERTILNEPLQVPGELVLRHPLGLGSGSPGNGSPRRSCLHFDGYHLSATCRPPVGHLSATCRPPVGHLSATCRPPVGGRKSPRQPAGKGPYPVAAFGRAGSCRNDRLGGAGDLAALRFANAAAALSTSAYGAQAGLSTLAQVTSFLEHQRQEPGDD